VDPVPDPLLFCSARESNPGPLDSEKNTAIWNKGTVDGGGGGGGTVYLDLKPSRFILGTHGADHENYCRLGTGAVW
jgi:hypothetical protein